MRTLRKLIGIFLIVAFVFCALIAMPVCADDGGSQGQTKSGQQIPAPAPQMPDLTGSLLLWYILCGWIW